MSKQRFLIAKYVPDLRRNEPHNIGVILWVRGKAKVRFLEEESARFVRDAATYRRWVDYWTRLSEGEAIQDRRVGRIEPSDERYVDALLATQKDNYVLEDGGEVTDDVSARDLSAATNYLFRELVTTKETTGDSAASETFAIAAKSAFKAAGLTKHKDFQVQYKLPCRIGATAKRTLNFHYAIANGVPESLFHRVAVDESQSVQSTAFMFDQQREVGRRNCAALIRVGKADIAKPDNASAIEVLEQYAIVINLANRQEAVEKLKEVAAT